MGGRGNWGRSSLRAACTGTAPALTTGPSRQEPGQLSNSMLVADELANGEEPKDARRGYAIAIAIMGRRQPGFFRLWRFVYGRTWIQLSEFVGFSIVQGPSQGRRRECSAIRSSGPIDLDNTQQRHRITDRSSYFNRIVLWNSSPIVRTVIPNRINTATP